MAVLQIPLPSGLRAFEQSVSLDGRTYQMAVHWNARAEQWFMTLASADGTPLVSAVRLVAHWPLLRKFASEALPPGELVLLDDSDTPRDPLLEDLGARHRLFYVDASELAT